jgi:hypothetical protein
MEKGLWDSINIDNWQAIPCVKGRLASETDVKQGKAVFFINDPDKATLAEAINLPACAIIYDKKTGIKIPSIAIQAESVDEKVLIGYRPISGGNGICTADEAEFIKEPDQRFYKI